MGISDSIPVDLYARIHKMEISPVWTKSCDFSSLCIWSLMHIQHNLGSEVTEVEEINNRKSQNWNTAAVYCVCCL